MSREKEGLLSKRAIRMGEIDDLVVKMLDVEEAKADFPNRLLYYRPTTKNDNLPEGELFSFGKYWSALDQWFVRWFGFPNNTHVDKEEGAKITPNPNPPYCEITGCPPVETVEALKRFLGMS